jgi:phosphate transport system protein
MQRAHTSKEFEQELRTLREKLLAMGSRAEGQIAQAVRALAERDDKLAQQVIERDSEIDRDELEIDQLAQTILATRQPVASDLRFLTMSLKFVTDLERIGDLATNIAKRALELNRMPQLKPYVDLPHMAQLVQGNLGDVLDSFVHQDADKAARAIEVDQEIDRMNASVFAELIAFVATDPATVTRVIPLTSVARYLERIGDHVKNLAEEVIYLVRGRDVRHRGAPRT